MSYFVFPGQGVQFVGMGKELCENSKAAAAIFEQAEVFLKQKITGEKDYPLQKIMFEGPEATLQQTEFTQTAIFLHSVAAAAALGENFKPKAVAGHSLGEFSALVAAKYLSLEEGLWLVYQRAHAMSKAANENTGTMAAIMTKTLENDFYQKVEGICNEVSKQSQENLVTPANYNNPQQLVISGTVAGVNLALEACKEQGLRGILLKVGGAFHSPLMQKAQEELAIAIEKANWQKGICPIYQNVNAKGTDQIESIQKNLLLQLTAPVLWSQTMQDWKKNGVDTVIELGPGQVLTNIFNKL